jgi:hypothetical protein
LNVQDLDRREVEDQAERRQEVPQARLHGGRASAEGELPSFLRGFAPDLIATSDDDKVVLEIKRAADLKGSTEIKELAAVIDKQAGWRFELMSLGIGPWDVVVPSEEKLERLIARGVALRDAGADDVAVIFLVSMLEELIRGVGLQHGLTGFRESTRAIVNELAFRGIVGNDTIDALDAGWDRRNRIVHGSDAGRTDSGDDIVALTAACRELREGMRLEAA